MIYHVDSVMFHSFLKAGPAGKEAKDGKVCVCVVCVCVCLSLSLSVCVCVCVREREREREFREREEREVAAPPIFSTAHISSCLPLSLARLSLGPVSVFPPDSSARFSSLGRSPER